MSTIELPPEAMPIVALLRDKRAVQDDLKADIDVLTARLQQIVGDHTEATIDGRVVVTWKPRATSRLDQARLKRELPELYAEFVRSDVSRVWLWK